MGFVILIMRYDVVWYVWVMYWLISGYFGIGVEEFGVFDG